MLSPDQTGNSQGTLARSGAVITRLPGACARRDHPGRDIGPGCSTEPNLKYLNKEGLTSKAVLNIILAASFIQNYGLHFRRMPI